MMLDDPYPLLPDQIERYRREGFIHLPEVFDAATLAEYEPTLTELTLAHDPDRDKRMEEKDLYGQAFIQVGNLWEMHARARAFSFSKRIARIAAELMGTRGVRMYHDQSLYKEAGGGFTPWHVDQQYWPLASPRSITAWIPMHPVPLEQGPMAFGRRSHLRDIARDLEISAESEAVICEQVQRQGIDAYVQPYALGEVSFHSGWTLHRAGPNQTNHPRKVHTVIYIDIDMCLAAPRNGNQKRDWQKWSPSSRVGEVMDDPLNPVLYEVAS